VVQQCITKILITQGWAINLALGPFWEGRVWRRAVPP